MSKELDWADRFLNEFCEERYLSGGGAYLAVSKDPKRVIDFIESLLTAKEYALRKAVEGMKSTENLQQMSHAGSDARARNKILDEVVNLLTPKKED